MEPLTVPGTLDSLDEIARYVIAAAAEAGLERKAAYRLRLAVDEIATNIVTYGYERSGLSGSVKVSADLDAETLTVKLEDQAIPYNPLETPSPDDLDAPLEERDLGGLGVYLTIQGVDRFDYEWRDGSNCNIFVMRRAAPEAPSQ